MKLCNEIHDIDPLINAIVGSPYLDESSDHIFSGAISKSEFVSHLAFEYYERIRVAVSPKKTLRQQFGASDDTEYERAYKTYPKLIAEGRKQFDRLGLPDLRDPELLLDLSENKLTHLNGRPIPVIYRKTIENFARNTSTRPIVPIFANGQIKSAKRCSDSRVNDVYQEYYHELQSYAANDSDWFSNAIDIFHMEENMHISLIYQLAHYMAEHSIKEFNPYRLQIFGLIPYEQGRRLENNMVCFNQKLFPALFSDKATFQSEYSRISAMLDIRGRLLFNLYVNEELKDAVLAIPEKTLIAFFRSTYNLFDLFEFPKNGHLNSKVIRLMRKISSAFLA